MSSKDYINSYRTNNSLAYNSTNLGTSRLDKERCVSGMTNFSTNLNSVRNDFDNLNKNLGNVKVGPGGTMVEEVDVVHHPNCFEDNLISKESNFNQQFNKQKFDNAYSNILNKIQSLKLNTLNDDRGRKMCSKDKLNYNYDNTSPSYRSPQRFNLNKSYGSDRFSPTNYQTRSQHSFEKCSPCRQPHNIKTIVIEKQVEPIPIRKPDYLPGADYKNIEVINENLEIQHSSECGYSRDLLLQKIEVQDKRIKHLENLLKEQEMKPNYVDKINRELFLDNQSLSNQLEFTLEYLDLCLKYLNHYFNILFHTNKRIKLHKFNIPDLKEFLIALERRMVELSDPNFVSGKDDNVKIVYKTDPNTNDIIKKLMDEISKLKSDLNSKNSRFNDNKLRKEKVVHFSLPEIEYTTDDDDDMFRGREVNKKVKMFDPKNLHDKYCGETKPVFHAFGWAGHGTKSVYEKKPPKDREKLVDFGIHEYCIIDKKNIIPVKKPNYSHIFNKSKSKLTGGTTSRFRENEEYLNSHHRTHTMETQFSSPKDQRGKRKGSEYTTRTNRTNNHETIDRDKNISTRDGKHSPSKMSRKSGLSKGSKKIKVVNLKNSLFGSLDQVNN